MKKQTSPTRRQQYCCCPSCRPARSSIEHVKRTFALIWPFDGKSAHPGHRCHLGNRIVSFCQLRHSYVISSSFYHPTVLWGLRYKQWRRFLLMKASCRCSGKHARLGAASGFAQRQRVGFRRARPLESTRRRSLSLLWRWCGCGTGFSSKSLQSSTEKVLPSHSIP